MPDTFALDSPEGSRTATRPAPVVEALGPLVPALLRRDGDGLAVKDAVSGVYVHADAGLLECLGSPSGDVIGHDDGALFEPTVVMLLRAADQAALAQVGALISEHKFEHRGVRREFSVLRQRRPRP